MYKPISQTEKMYEIALKVAAKSGADLTFYPAINSDAVVAEYLVNNETKRASISRFDMYKDPEGAESLFYQRCMEATRQ